MDSGLDHYHLTPHSMKTPGFRFLRVSLLLSLTWLCGWTGVSLAQPPLLLGVHPYLQKDEIIRRFTPLADYLSAELNRPVEVRVGKDYQAHLQAIGNDDIDIAYLGPSLYVETTKLFGSKPLLARLEANGKPTFQGHIIIRQNSPMRRLTDLKNHYFAFGDPESTMSSLVPQAMLLQNGIKLSDLSGYRHYDGHVNVALAVLSGDADAGAVKEEVFDKYQPRGLRSLQATPAISEHLFVTRSNLSWPLVEKIRVLMLGLRTPKAVNKILKPIKKTATGLVEVEDSDYDSLRRILDTLARGQ
jgi:phosphonate transport system substrate-binding protein